jgi:hypothetical protein
MFLIVPSMRTQIPKLPTQVVIQEQGEGKVNHF